MRRRVAVLPCLLVGATLGAGEAAAVPRGVDLARPSAETMRVIGDRGDTAAYAVAGAGDVNGDGVGDLVVGAPYADYNGRRDSGSVFVVYGRRPFDGVDLHFLDTRGGGYRIDGVAAGDRLGSSVAGGRDLDGDGRADVVAGASRATFFGRRRAGVAYVLYGESRNGAIDLANADPAGFEVIGGRSTGDGTGASVASPGDVTGDGVDDLVVGAPGADSRVRGYTSSNTVTGAAYVIHGARARRGATRPLDLAARDVAPVWQLDGAAATERVGTSVAGAGDTDGDGIGDVLVGAPTADRNRRLESGSVYVLRGGPRATVQSLAEIADIGQRIDGPVVGARLGQSVAGIGDVNGDGIGDVVAGAPGASVGTRSAAGRAVVLYGRGPQPVPTRPLDARALGNGGYSLLGANADDRAGWSVASAGDVNRDGLPDVVVGAYDADPNCRGGSGSAYVVYGKFGRAPVYLSRLQPQRGYRIDGANAGDRLGYAVGSAPGFSGPGPVVLAASSALNVPRPYSGAVYALPPGTRTAPSRRYRTRLPLRVRSRPGGRAADYEGFLSVPVSVTDGTLRDVYAAAYTFGGRRVGAVSRSRLSGSGVLDIRLRERLRPGGYTVIVTGTGPADRYCGRKSRAFTLRFR